MVLEMRDPTGGIQSCRMLRAGKVRLRPHRRHRIAQRARRRRLIARVLRSGYHWITHLGG